MVCNKRTLEALIEAGAFDSLGHTRRGLVHVYEPAVDAVLDTKRNEAIGQFDLFGSGGHTPGTKRTPIPGGDVATSPIPVPPGERDKSVLLGFEREMLGLYVSDHPLFGVEHVLVGAADMSIAALHADAAVNAANAMANGVKVNVTSSNTSVSNASSAVTAISRHSSRNAKQVGIPISINCRMPLV